MIYYCDGFSTPEKSGIVVCNEQGDVIYEQTFTKHNTNNEAEYKAVLKALDFAQEGDMIYTDSRLVTGQVKDGWKIKAEHLKGLQKIAYDLVQTKKIKLYWISRKHNKAGIEIERRYTNA